MTKEEFASKIESLQAEVSALVTEYNEEHIGQDDEILSVWMPCGGSVNNERLILIHVEKLPGLETGKPDEDGFIICREKVGNIEYAACQQVKK